MAITIARFIAGSQSKRYNATCVVHGTAYCAVPADT